MCRESKPNSHASLAGRVRFDVLLTTYEMMLSEESALNSLDWETMLIDEGHRLKNKASRLFQVLHHFKTRQRTLLTGTPLQNSLDELFMLMHFLEPEKFSSLEDFQVPLLAPPPSAPLRLRLLRCCLHSALSCVSVLSVMNV